MSKWLCIPGLGNSAIPIYSGWNYDDGESKFVGITCDIEPEIFVGIDTEDIQNSLYSSFNENGWKNGEKLGITKDDVFSIKEYETKFDIFVNGKYTAMFVKDRQYS